jgi:arylsulfatase A-like enzyme
LTTPTQPRPNIVYIFNDQHRHDVLGCAGNPIAVTPNMDRLASEGVRFERAWCASPVCRPSRASIITGWHPHQHGTVGNSGPDFDPELPTMMKSLQHAGYRTAHFGKSHYHQHRYLQIIKEGKTLDLRDYDEYVASFGFDHVMEEYDKYVHLAAPHITTPYSDFLAGHGLLETYQAQISSVFRGTPTHWDGQTSVLPQEYDLTSFIADHAVDWIDSVEARQPFFVQLSFVAPHVPLIADPTWAGHYADVDISLGPRDLPEPTNEVWAAYVENLRDHAQAGVDDDAYVLAGARQYYGMVSLIDQRIGDVIAALERRNMLDNTWIVLSADHGEMLGDHRLMAKMGFYKSSVQVPAIIRPPAPIEARMVSGVVSALDLTATIVDIAGAEPVDGCSGQSLIGTLEGDTPPDRPVFSTIQRGSIPTMAVGEQHRGDDEPLFVAVTDRTRRFTLEAVSRTPCELFDLDADPDESHNLVADPGEASSVAHYREIIEELLATPAL